MSGENMLRGKCPTFVATETEQALSGQAHAC